MRNEGDLKKAIERFVECLPREASPGAEQRALARFRALRKPRSRVWAYTGGMAACLVLSLILGIEWQASHSRPQQAAQALSESSLAAAGFIMLPYGQNDVPLEQAIIVRVKMESATGSIDADLLVGQDGMARAFRLVE
ncbi:MAG: hypothetical protein JO210_08180 [Acidobacteriaceae bacterium]|nr:hypothetical protein [Acidobacteriaceae bacterium]